MKSATLEQLKQLVQTKTQARTIPFSLLASGLPCGAITEISGFGKTEFVLQFLKENKDFKIAWIEKNFSAYPFGFLQKEIDLNRVLFIEGHEDVDWCAYQVLRAQVFQSVVLYADDLELNALRRIQLESEKSQAVTVWLTNEVKTAWPISLRLAVEKGASALQVNVVKQRMQ